MDQAKEAELKQKYGRFVRIELAGHELAFKPLNKAKVADLKKNQTEKPELAVELSINAVKMCCVYGDEHFEALANEYPLAFCGGEQDGVLNVLMRMAHGAVAIEVK